MSKLMILAGVLFLILGTAGCGAWHQTPGPASQPPRISDLSLAPPRVLSGANVEIRLSFNFEDPNGDVGPDTAEVELRAEVLSGHLPVSEAPSRVMGYVRMEEDGGGLWGWVDLVWTLDVPASAYGELQLSVALLDRAGRRSNSLRGEIVISEEPGGGCTFLDGDRHPVTSYRPGRQVFLRVRDPDNNTSTNVADVLYGAAWIESGATGDRETVAWLVETGPNTGVFEGPVGGFLLVGSPSDPGDGVLFARDRDTLIALYQDPNDPGDVCIALAKLM